MSLSRLPAGTTSDSSPQVPGSSPPPPKVDMSLSYSRPNPSSTPPSGPNRLPSANAYGTSSTVGMTLTNVNSSTKVNEFGYGRTTAKVNPTQPTTQKMTGPEPRNTQLEDSLPKLTAARSARPGGNATNRLTVTNMPDEPDVPKIKTPQPNRQASTPANGASARTPWPTAEDEKKRLYNKARADVERVQGGIQRSVSAVVCYIPSMIPL